MKTVLVFDAVDVIVAGIAAVLLLICGIVSLACWLKEKLQQRNRTRR